MRRMPDGKARHREDLGKIVDEHLTAKFGGAGNLLFLGQLEKHIGGIDLR